MPLALAGTARADAIPCGLVENDVIAADGLLDDWDGVAGVTFSGADRKDASFSVRCNYDEARLYVAIDVADDWVVRRGKKDKRGPEDQLSITVGRLKLEVAPGDPDRRVPRRLVGNIKGLQVADSRRERGFAVELSIPRAAAGAGHGVPAVAFAVRFSDADMRTGTSYDETVDMPAGSQLVLAEGDAIFRQFLADQRLTARDVWFDQRANVDGLPGEERVVAAGRTLAVISDRYAFVQLGAARKDIKKVSLERVDWYGKKKAIVVHHVERGGGGSREVVTVWHVSPDGQFARVLAFEVAKESKEGRLTNTWAFVTSKWAPDGSKKKARSGCCAVRVKVGEVRGFTQDTWRESAATDVAPILLPWGDATTREWVIAGDSVYENSP